MARNLWNTFVPAVDRSDRRTRRRRPGTARHGRRLWFEGLEDRTLLATVTWINPAGGNWDTASNWSTGALPGSGDDVVINSLNSGASVTHTQNVTDTVNSVTASAPITLAGGTLNVATTLSDTSAVTLAGGTLSGATIQTGTTIASTNFSSGTLSGVTLAGTLNGDSEYFGLTISSGLTLSGGTVDLGGAATMGFNGTQMLGGTGSVIFADSNFNTSMNESGSSGSVLTIGSGVTIEGNAGSINAAAGTSFVNQGTITANTTSGTLTLNGTWSNSGTIDAGTGGSLALNGAWSSTSSVSITGGGNLKLTGSWTNSGTIAMTSSTVDLGGAFTLANLGTFNRSGGTVDLTGTLNNAGTTLALNNTTGTWLLGPSSQAGGTIVGGTVTTLGSAVLGSSNFGSGTLSGVTLAGTLNGDSEYFGLTITNGLTLSGGTVDLDGAATMGFNGTQMLGGTGSVVFADSNFNTSMNESGSSGSVLTIGSGVTIEGNAGSINAAAGTSFVNQGTITANTTGGTLTLNGTWSSSGTIDAVSGGTLALSGSWSNTGTISETNANVDLGGTITIASLGTLTSSGGSVFLTGTLNNAGTTLALSNTTGSLYLRGGTIVGGTVTTSGSAVLGSSNLSSGTLSGVALAGTLNGDSEEFGLTISSGLTLSGGTVNLGGAATMGFNGTQMLGGTGSVVFADSNFNTSMNESGSSGSVLTIGSGVTIEGNAGSINAAAGTSFVNQGTITANTTGGTLTLNGTWSSSDTIDAVSGGTLALSGSWSNTGTISETDANVDLGGTFNTSGLNTLTGSGGTYSITGTVTNTGTLALSGSAISPAYNLHGGTIDGGTISTPNGGELTATQSGGTLNGVTLAGTLLTGQIQSTFVEHQGWVDARGRRAGYDVR